MKTALNTPNLLKLIYIVLAEKGLILQGEVPICKELLKRLEETHSVLRAFDYKG